MLLLFICSVRFFHILFVVAYRHRTVTEQHTMRKSCKNKPTEQEEKKKTQHKRCKQSTEWSWKICKLWLLCVCVHALCVMLKYISSIYCVQLQSAGLMKKRERERQKKKRKKSTENRLQYSIQCEYIDCAYERYFAFHLRVHTQRTAHTDEKFSSENKWFASQTFTITPFQ